MRKTTTTFGVLLLISFAILLVQSAKYERKLNRVPTHFIEKDDAVNYNFYNKYYSTKHKTTIGNAVPMFGGFLVVGYYYANITIGTPAVNYNLIIDTGSSNIVLNVEGCASCGTGPSYNPSLSSSSSSIPFGSSTCNVCSPPDYFSDTSICAYQQPFSYNNQCGFGITYGGGGTALYGYLINDIVCLGPADDGFCVDEQPIGLITNQYPASLYTGFPLQGIFGMAYIMNSCNPTCVDVLYDTVSEDLSLPNYFGMCLSASNGGSIDLGYINSTKYTGDLQYTPINMERWFNIILEDIQIGGISIEVPKSFYYTTNDVIGTFVDSGTSIILFNAYTFGEFQKVFEKNFPSLPSLKNLFAEECVLATSIPNLSAYPDISFIFNNQNGQSFSLPVPASSYLYQVSIKNENFYCLGVQGISSIGVVLGDVFMENYYVVFDKENSRLGFAPVVASAC